MAFTVLEAAQLLDEEKLSKAQIELILSVRDGRLKDELDCDEEAKDDLKALKDYGFLKVVALSHPRVAEGIPAYIPSDDGTTILMELDKRYKEHVVAAKPYSLAPVQVEEEIARTPTDKELPIMAAKEDGREIEKNPQKEAKEADSNKPAPKAENKKKK